MLLIVFVLPIHAWRNFATWFAQALFHSN